MTSTPPTPPGGSSPPSTKPLPPLPAPPPRPPSPFGAPRFGQRAMADILPLNDAVARVDLRLIGNPLYDLIDMQTTEINVGDIEPFIKTLETNRELVAQLRAQLDAQWETVTLKGAAIIFPWTEPMQMALGARLSAVQLSQSAYRVTDPLLALNLLARTRGALLLPRSPAALDRSYLSRSLAFDDPRLIKTVVALGCPYLPIVDPKPDEDTTDEEEQ